MKQNNAQTVLAKWETHIRGDEEEFIKYCFPDFVNTFYILNNIYFNSDVVKVEVMTYGDEAMVFVSCSMGKFLNYYNETKITRLKKTF